MSARPSKRARTAAEGGSHHDFIPLANDDYFDIYSREGRVRQLGGGTTAAAPTARVVQKSDDKWKDAGSWAPLDDPEYALDPDGVLYDLLLQMDVLEEEPDRLQAFKKKKPKTKVSRRPHVVWKELHRATYLDEICRFSGRGDFLKADQCPDCIARHASDIGLPQYRCNECFIPDLTCRSCCIRRHKTQPFHRIQYWDGSCFTPVSLKSLGLVIQLNHAGLYCSNPQPCHASMLVLHVNGIHDVSISYCGCSRTLPQHIQLLRRRLYPASQLIVKTCATFDLLDLLHKLALTTKASTYDFYRAIEKLSDNTGINPPKSRYRSLFRMVLQWRHLKLLKWGGRGHDPSGADGTEPGGLALRCPSCPYPGINLPEGWENASPDSRYLYRQFIAMDANFRLKNQLVSSYSQDPGLGIGWAYMVPREHYEQFILSRTNDQDISTCVGFQALAQANTRFSQGLRTTGVGGVFCGRSEMVMPLGIGNLPKGERYSTMDYIFASALRFALVCHILVSYDIVCQWFKNLLSRMADNWPPGLELPPSTSLTPAIPKLHEPMHNTPDHEQFSLNFIPGVGLSDLECPERVWSAHNALGNSTKTQGPGSRQDVLDDHFAFWNWQKYVGMGKTLLRKYRAAVADRNIQSEGHRGLTASLDTALVQKWEEMCKVWEKDSFPKQSKNPYEAEGAVITEAQAKKELAAAEAKRLKDGGISLHETSAYAFIVLALEIEESQRRIRRLAKGVALNMTNRKESGLTEQRNQLTVRIRAWEQLLPIYLPGLLQFKANCQSMGEDLTTVAAHSESHHLWLPSRIPATHRAHVCFAGLSEIEEKLRTAQCHDALQALRNILKIKSRLIKFKNKNLRGQREGTRSRAIIDRVHEKAKVAAEKYRTARAAKASLHGSGDWEQELQVLNDADVRGYQDPDRLRPRQGRPGTVEDSQRERATEHLPAGGASETDDFTLFREERTRRDGTGETRRTLSWIWKTAKVADDPENATDDILRSEWAKSRARAARCEEEVRLLREEMRRTIAFLNWRANWWKEQGPRRMVDEALTDALMSYSNSQSALYTSLALHFQSLWKNPLADPPTTSSSTSTTHAHAELLNLSAAEPSVESDNGSQVPLEVRIVEMLEESGGSTRDLDDDGDSSSDGDDEDDEELEAPFYANDEYDEFDDGFHHGWPAWEEEVIRITGGVGVDHVIEVAGGTLPKSIKSARMGSGQIHLIGVVALEDQAPSVVFPLIKKAVTLRGILVGTVSQFREMNRMIAAQPGLTRPLIYKVFPFDKAVEAYAYMEGQKHVGRVIIKVA